MAYDLKKLVEDLKAAKAAAEAAVAANGEDGGTCNFDSAVLVMPRVNEQKLLQTMKDAGLDGYKLSGSFWRGCFSLSTPSGGQANRRTRQAEAMGKALTAAGWQTRMYYQMD